MANNVSVIGPCDIAQKLAFHFLAHLGYGRGSITIISFHFDLIGINKHNCAGVVGKTGTVQPDPHFTFPELKVSDKTGSSRTCIPYRAAYMQGVAVTVNEYEIVRNPVIIHTLLYLVCSTI